MVAAGGDAVGQLERFEIPALDRWIGRQHRSGAEQRHEARRQLCRQGLVRRRVAAHPDCVPPPERLLLGDMRETLAEACGRLGGRVALAHFDVGTGDAAANRALAAELTPLVLPLLCRNAVLASDPPIENPELQPLALPEGVALGRYHLYRRV